ncbi:hypothetical protein JCM11251_002449 [Rhodosporidiobolus azoricus]
MARKKPVSGKARKAQLQAKRANKSANFVPTPFPADLAAALSSSSSPSTPIAPSVRPSAPRTDKIGQRFRTPEQRERDALHAGRLALESRFIRLPKEVAEVHRQQAASDVLPRPIPPQLAVLDQRDVAPEKLDGEQLELTCPKRPKWNYSLSKRELEKNEGEDSSASKGVFKKWLEQTDTVLGRSAVPVGFEDTLDPPEGSSGPSGSPTFFERNLNVWRQLWRTVERSDILLVLIDVRFPLLHFPPSLESYLPTLKPPKPVILVLTKTDLVPAWLAEAWKIWFEERGHKVVLMESYREVERREETQGTQPRFIPAAPPAARLALVDALRSAHAAQILPPEIVRNDPAKLARWRPRVRREVDWDLVEEEGGDTGVHAGSGQTGERPRGKGKRRAQHADSEQYEEPGQETQAERFASVDDEPPFLTVGLIGHPNVGKSSLLNAFLSKKVVRASRTPGKTKTLQTIFWNRNLRLCDCPGLVCPSSAGLERQVLAGVLPIQNIEPVLRFIGQGVPLEKILRLRHPDGEQHQHDDEFSLDAPGNKARWTTDDILASYAEQQGFLTAKVGRPDIYRAGASILRLLHSSSIPWAFRPPSMPLAVNEQEGLWLKEFTPYSTGSRAAVGGISEEEEEDGGGGEEDSDSVTGEEEEDSAVEAETQALKAVQGAFAALDVEGEESDTGSEAGYTSEEEEEEA